MGGDLVDQHIDLRQLPAHGAEDHIGTAGIGQFFQPGDDVGVRAEHVTVAEVLEGAARAHRPQERLALGGVGLLARSGAGEIREVAVTEDELVRVVAGFARLLADEVPIPDDPLLGSRATREPVLPLQNAAHDRGVDVAIRVVNVRIVGRIRHTGASGHPNLRHLADEGLQLHVVELVVLAVVRGDPVLQ